jgi:hypothetical protein
MYNGITPNYLSDLIPQHNESYHLRNHRQVNSRTQIYNSSFLPSARAWNLLPVDTRNSSSVAAFKRCLKKTKASPLFNVGSRIGQILHARLRLDCSSLNFDLHKKSIIQSPLCLCGEIETVHHFFFSCSSYDIIRSMHLRPLPCHLILNNVLYGDERLSFNTNEKLIFKVQQFILPSKRFTN